MATTPTSAHAITFWPAPSASTATTHHQEEQLRNDLRPRRAEEVLLAAVRSSHRPPGDALTPTWRLEPGPAGGGAYRGRQVRGRPGRSCSEFAIAVGETDPIYHRSMAAAPGGRPPRPSRRCRPSPGRCCRSLRAGQVVYGDPELGLDYSGGRPRRAGVRLPPANPGRRPAAGRPARSPPPRPAGRHELLTLETEVTPPEDGEPVCLVGGPCCRAAPRHHARAGHDPRVNLAEVRPGDTLPEVAETIERMDLVRYAGASGDFKLIHWNDEVARAVAARGDRPRDVLHGRRRPAWSPAGGRPGRDRRLRVRFSTMIEPGQTLTVKGEVAEVEGRRVWSASTPRTRRARRS